MPRADRSAWVYPALAAGLTAAFFLPTLGNGFVNWDDPLIITRNLHLRQPLWTEIRWMFSHLTLGSYQPLAWLSYRLDYALWGLRPFGYHLTQLLIHATAAAVFFHVAENILSLSLKTHGENKLDRLRPAALLAALLFAVHPLRVESVAWASQRRDVLAGLFYLISILTYLRAVAGDRAPRSLWVSLTAYLFALLSKGTVLTLPAVLVLLDIFPLRRLGSPRQWASRRLRRVWTEKIPYLLMAVVFTLIGAASQGGMGSMPAWADYGAEARLIEALFGLSFYLWKTLWPVGLSHLYTHPYLAACGVGMLFVSLTFLVVGAVSVGLRVSHARTGLLGALRRVVSTPGGTAVLLAAAYYLITLIPLLGLVKFGRQVAADRYTYIACMGWPILASGLWLKLRQGLFPRILAAALVVVLGILTWQQSLVWEDSLSLWTRAVQINPRDPFIAGQRSKALSARRNHDGIELFSNGRYPEALAGFMLALEAEPARVEVHNNMGLVLSRMGRLEEAVAAFRRAVELDGGNVEAHANLGIILARLRHDGEAVASLEKALELDPENLRARRVLKRITNPRRTP